MAALTGWYPILYRLSPMAYVPNTTKHAHATAFLPTASACHCPCSSVSLHTVLQITPTHTYANMQTCSHARTQTDAHACLLNPFPLLARYKSPTPDLCHCRSEEQQSTMIARVGALCTYSRLMQDRQDLVPDPKPHRALQISFELRRSCRHSMGGTWAVYLNARLYLGRFYP